jgi:hypothetical protein
LHSAGVVVRNLCLVPHEFSLSQKAERIGMAVELQYVLQFAKHRAWQYFLTGNELWFCYTIDHDRLSISDGEEVPTRPRGMMASRKRMLTVFLPPLGFAFVEIPPKWIPFDLQYFCSDILSGIAQNRPSKTSEDWRRRMVVHLDNAYRQVHD